MRRILLLFLAFLTITLFLFYFPKDGGKSEGIKGQSGLIRKILPSSEVEVVLGGDVMLGRSVLIKSIKEGDFRYPFLKVGSFILDSDISFVNLESPFSKVCPRNEYGMVFCADREMVEGLLFSGVDIVGIENNHILNYGQEGLLFTKEVLDDAGILYADSKRLVVKKVNGTSFGFLAFNFLDNVPSQKDWDLISDSDLKVDVLIVSPHWGEEYQRLASTTQRSWAKEMVKNGADVVVGHHPHWVMDWEYIDGKPVYYSLGNLVFDQMWSENTKKGMMVKLTFKKGKIVKQELINTYIKEWGQPEIVK